MKALMHGGLSVLMSFFTMMTVVYADEPVPDRERQVRAWGREPGRGTGAILHGASNHGASNRPMPHGWRTRWLEEARCPAGSDDRLEGARRRAAEAREALNRRERRNGERDRRRRPEPPPVHELKMWPH